MYAYICIGKTYFITTLISILLQGQCKVVVSASSNKAVCVALEELLSIPWVHKHKRVVLVGVEDTIDSVSSVAPSTTLSTPSTTSNHHTAHPLADYSIHIPLKHQLPSHLTDQINQFLHPTSAKDVYAFAYLSRLERIMDAVSVYFNETTQAFNKIYLPPQTSPTTPAIPTISTTSNTIDMFPPLPTHTTYTKQDSSKHSNNGHGAARKHLKSKPTFNLYNYFLTISTTMPTTSSSTSTDNSNISSNNNSSSNTTTDNTHSTSTNNNTANTTTNSTTPTATTDATATATSTNNSNFTKVHGKDTLISLTHEYTRLKWLLDHIIRISTHISYIAITIHTSATDLFLAHFKTNFRLFFRASDRLIGLIETLLVELYCYIHNIILPNEHNISNNIISNTANMHSDSSDSNTVRQHNICNYIHDISTQFKNTNNTLCTITATILAFTATTSYSSSDLLG